MDLMPIAAPWAKAKMLKNNYYPVKFFTACKQPENTNNWVLPVPKVLLNFNPG
jgi:hypothetical protein